MTAIAFDTRRADAFAEQVLGILNGGALALMLSLGHRAGLFDGMCRLDFATSGAIAEAAGLQERYVREWLGAMVTSGIVEYDASTRSYRLPPEHAAALCRKTASHNLAATAQWIPLLARVEDEVLTCFERGGGVPYASYDRFHQVMAEDRDHTVVAALFDGVLPRVRALDTLVRSIGSESDRDALAALADGIQTELAHFRAFAGVYDQLQTPQDPPLDAVQLEHAEWSENRALAELRARHREQHGELGRRAEAFTEGGYCTLYTAGRSLAGRGGIDDAIAAACATVVDDEWDHMIAGIADLDAESLADEDWALLATLTAEQGRYRIRMRNAQFGRPLEPGALRRAESGSLVPLAFDFERAGFAAP